MRRPLTLVAAHAAMDAHVLGRRMLADVAL
jgi:hypothetical protein